MSDLIIIRGLPGSGKSTLARIISPDCNIAADDYFDAYHDGSFIDSEVKKAHSWCKDRVEDFMSQRESIICVHNTFTQYWEFEDYLSLAEKHLYRVHLIITENRHGGDSVHGVPDSVFEKMADRFEIKLGCV